MAQAGLEETRRTGRHQNLGELVPPKLALGVLLAAVAVLSAPAVAVALPGDPPIVPLSPMDGASVPADPAGITVTYRCPAYRDGSVAGVLEMKRGGELRPTGRVRGGRFRGEVYLALDACSGTRKLDAVRKG